MTKATEKTDRLRARIDEFQAQLQSSDTLPTATLANADGSADRLTRFVTENPGLAIAAGLGLGILASALIPRAAGRKLVRGGMIAASTAGELGLALSRDAMRKAEDATREGRELLEETAASASRVASDAGRRAAEAGRAAAETGRKAGSGAQRLAVDASERARELGSDLAKRASDVASRLRH